MTKFALVVTSYGRNKNLYRIKKNQEKINNSPGYRFAALKKQKKIQKTERPRETQYSLAQLTLSQL